jgi:hypothetical protein
MPEGVWRETRGRGSTLCPGRRRRSRRRGRESSSAARGGLEAPSSPSPLRGGVGVGAQSRSGPCAVRPVRSYSASCVSAAFDAGAPHPARPVRAESDLPARGRSGGRASSPRVSQVAQAPVVQRASSVLASGEGSGTPGRQLKNGRDAGRPASRAVLAGAPLGVRRVGPPRPCSCAIRRSTQRRRRARLVVAGGQGSGDSPSPKRPGEARVEAAARVMQHRPHAAGPPPLPHQTR